KTSDAIVATVDFMPTFASLAGFDLPTDRKIDGVDQTSLLLGTNKQGNRDNYYYQGNGVRQGKWKYLVADQKVYGYARDMERPVVEELYNLDRDIGETNNLATRHPVKVQMLKALMNSIKEDATIQPVQKLR
ncbi:MAG: N-acetylgalactosamine 6-sulfate sulfatase, partial [Planctomycetaceae bacterium]|nr:N-acetylgalactosamine 6-sulfate sulfatase [Planctomycetaceae bacterium]